MNFRFVIGITPEKEGIKGSFHTDEFDDKIELGGL